MDESITRRLYSPSRAHHLVWFPSIALHLTPFHPVLLLPTTPAPSGNHNSVVCFYEVFVCFKDPSGGRLVSRRGRAGPRTWVRFAVWSPFPAASERVPWPHRLRPDPFTRLPVRAKDGARCGSARWPVPHLALVSSCGSWGS